MERVSRKSIITTLLTVFACILAVVAVFVFIPMSTKASAENEPSVWDGDLVAAGWGVEHTAPVDGKVSEEAPSTKPDGYVATFDEEDDTKVATVTISDAESLAYFAREIYEFSANYEGCEVALKTDIDLNNKLWMPIGIDNRKNKDDNGIVSLYLSFKGTFDGENHTISNLNGTKFAEALVSRNVGDDEHPVWKLFIDVGDNSVFVPSDGNEYSYGLFGVAANLIIKNINLPQFTLDLTNVTTTLGSKKIEADGVGGIVGFVGGSVVVENCVVGMPKTEENKDVVDVNVVRCAGGIVGRAYVGIGANGGFGSDGTTNPVTIKNCTNYLNISTAADPAQKGGILGYANNCSKIEFDNCKNYGDIAGEYVGGITSFLQQGVRLEAVFKDCYNEGNITATHRGVGGIIGYIAKDSSGGTVTFNDCVNKGDIVSITKDNSDKYQMAGGISGGIIGSIEMLSEPKPMGSVVTVSAENLYNYGKIVGAAGKDQSAVAAGSRQLKYVGGIFGQMSISESTYDISAAWARSNDPDKEDAYPYSVVKLTNIVNCGEVTAAGEYRGQFLYIGGVIGCVSHNQTIPGQTTRIYVDTLINTYGGVNAIDYCGTHNSNPYDSRTDVLYRELEKREDIASVVPTAVLELAEDGKTVVGITGKDTSGADIVGDFKVVIPNTVTKIADQAFSGYGVYADKGIDHDTTGGTNKYSLPHLYSSSTQHLVAVEFEANSKLQTVGALAFAGTDVKQISLPESVTEIGFGAFAQTQLEKVVINSAAVVADSAFGNNNFLERAVLRNDNITFSKNAFSKYSPVELKVIASGNASYGDLQGADFADDLVYVVPVEYYDLSTSSTVPAGTEPKLYNNDYKMSYDETTDTWALNSSIDYVGLTALGGNQTTWYTNANCTEVATTENVTAMLAANGVQTVKLYARIIGVGDSFVAKTGLVYDGTSYTIGAINALLATNSKKVTTETVAITEYNGSAEDLPTSIRNAGTYTVTITPEDGEATTLTITIAKASVNLAASGAFQWRVGGASLSDGPVYLVDGNPTLVKPEDTNYTVEAAIESLVRVRGEPQTLSLTGTGFTAAVKDGSSAQGTAIGKYTTTYTLTADGNHTLSLNGAIVNGAARGLTVTLDEGVVTVTKVWYIVAMGNWLVDNHGNDYAIADRVYGSSTAFVAPRLNFGDNEASRNATVFTLTRSGYNSIEFGYADFAKYLNNTIPVGSYTLHVSAPAIEYYEEYDEDGAPVGEPIACPAFGQDVIFEVAAATLSYDYDINGYINGKTFSYLFGETSVSETNVVTVNSISGALENIYRNLPTNGASYWGAAQRPVIEVTLVSDKTNVYSTFTRPEAVGVYSYYYRLRIDNYNVIDSDNQGEPLGFTLAVYGVVELPAIAAHQYTGATQVAFIADSEQYRVVKNDGGVNAGTYDVELELIHPECHIWIDQTLTGEHPAKRTVGFVIEQAANAWTRLPNIVNWSYDSFDADVNRIRAIPLYLDTNAELYFKVATDEEGANVISGLGHITVDRNGKITDTTVIGLLNGLAVGRYYLVSVVDETSNYESMVQSIGFNVTKAFNHWASGESDLVLPSWVVGDYDPAVNTIAVNPEHGVANIKVTDINGVEYYNSVTGLNNLAEAPVGKYLLIAWVDASDNFEALAERTFTIEVLETIGLPWWGTLLIVIGVLAVVAIVLFILWKKGVFQILTGKLVLAIRTKATVDATIAAVRASKKADEAKAAIAAAKAKERASERRAKAAAERALPVEERAAALEAKAQAAAAKADKMRARAEAMQARADRMKEEAGGKAATEAVEQPTEAPTTEAEAAATETEE